jgi:hypothetical protein
MTGSQVRVLFAAPSSVQSEAFEIAVSIDTRSALAFCRTMGAFDRPKIVLEVFHSN